MYCQLTVLNFSCIILGLFMFAMPSLLSCFVTMCFGPCLFSSFSSFFDTLYADVNVSSVSNAGADASEGLTGSK